MIENRCFNCHKPISKNLDTCKNCIEKVIKLGHKNITIKYFKQENDFTR